MRWSNGWGEPSDPRRTSRSRTPIPYADPLRDVRADASAGPRSDRGGFVGRDPAFGSAMALLGLGKMFVTLTLVDLGATRRPVLSLVTSVF